MRNNALKILNSTLPGFHWLAIGFALLVTPACFAQDSGIRLETGGIQIILPQGWELLNQPTNIFTQVRARNSQTGVAVSAGAFKMGFSLEQYVAIGIAAFEASPEQQIGKIANLTGIPAEEIEKAVQSQIGRNMLAQIQRAHETTHFELIKVNKIKISSATVYEAQSKLTILKSGQVIFSRQFTLSGTSPNEIVNIAFAGASEDIFQDQSLADSIQIK
jgi:hypothetical protein